jgi:hypothetical protein
MSCSNRIADRRAERIAHHFTIQAGRRCYSCRAIIPRCRQQYTWFWPKFVRYRGRDDTPGQAFKALRLCLGRAPDRRTKVFGRAAPKPVGPSLDRLLEIALEVRRAGDKPGVRGRGGPALAELRFLGVVSTKL